MHVNMKEGTSNVAYGERWNGAEQGNSEVK